MTHGCFSKMALKSSTHESCSCVSPDGFKNLNSKQRQGTGVRVTFTYTELSYNYPLTCIIDTLNHSLECLCW